VARNNKMLKVNYSASPNYDLHNFARMANARTGTAYRHFIVKIVTLETDADIEKIVLLPSVRLRHPVNNEKPF
jgi:hypothetical protein